MADALASHASDVPVLAGGLWGVLATPFSSDGRSVDVSSLRRLVDDQRSVGATGVVILGVFGEAARLSADEMVVVAETVGSCADGLGMVLGLGAPDGSVVTRAARLVEACGRPADIMLQLTSSPSAEIAATVAALHETTGGGVVLQDYPALSGATRGPAELASIADAGHVVAVKSEAPPTSEAVAAFAAISRIPIYGGLGGVGLLDELAAGSHGVMTGFSHPVGLARVLDAWRIGGFASAHVALQPWLPLMVFEGQPGVGLAIRKMALSRRGVIDHPVVRAPARAFPDSLASVLDQHLRAVAGTY